MRHTWTKQPNKDLDKHTTVKFWICDKCKCHRYKSFSRFSEYMYSRSSVIFPNGAPSCTSMERRSNEPLD